MPDQVDKFLSKYDTSVSDLARKVRQVVKKTVKGVIEHVDLPAKMIMYSLGPGYKGMVCTIIPSRKGVKLGFYRGVDLPDPAQLLTGTGKVHRHVVIHSEAVVERPELIKLLNAAGRVCNDRLGE